MVPYYPVGVQVDAWATQAQTDAVREALGVQVPKATVAYRVASYSVGSLEDIAQRLSTALRRLTGRPEKQELSVMLFDCSRDETVLGYDVVLNILLRQGLRPRHHTFVGGGAAYSFSKPHDLRVVLQGARFPTRLDAFLTRLDAFA